jgi:membrane protease YdiL (CAAX protease family)
MTHPALGASLHGVPRVVAVVLVAFLGVGQPVLSWWSHRRFRRALRRDRPADPVARRQRYRRTAVTEWLLVLVVVAVVVAEPGLRLGQLGLRWPGLAGAAAPFSVVGLLGLVATVAVYLVVRRRLPAAAPAGAEAVLALLPRTFAERRAFVGLAVTAGICEETLYRGFLIAVAGALLPGLGVVELVAVSAVLFGLAHLYQGPLGVLGTGVLGGCLAVLYLGSGSLLLPACYHILLDLRVLLLPLPGACPGRGRHAVGSGPGGGGNARHRA